MPGLVGKGAVDRGPVEEGRRGRIAGSPHDHARACGVARPDGWKLREEADVAVLRGRGVLKELNDLIELVATRVEPELRQRRIAPEKLGAHLRQADRLGIALVRLPVVSGIDPRIIADDPGPAGVVFGEEVDLAIRLAPKGGGNALAGPDECRPEARPVAVDGLGIAGVHVPAVRRVEADVGLRLVGELLEEINFSVGLAPQRGVDAGGILRRQSRKAPRERLRVAAVDVPAVVRIDADAFIAAEEEDLAVGIAPERGIDPVREMRGTDWPVPAIGLG